MSSTALMGRAAERATQYDEDQTLIRAADILEARAAKTIGENKAREAALLLRQYAES